MGTGGAGPGGPSAAGAVGQTGMGVVHGNGAPDVTWNAVTPGDTSWPMPEAWEEAGWGRGSFAQGPACHSQAQRAGREQRPRDRVGTGTEGGAAQGDAGSPAHPLSLFFPSAIATTATRTQMSGSSSHPGPRMQGGGQGWGGEGTPRPTP